MNAARGLIMLGGLSGGLWWRDARRLGARLSRPAAAASGNQVSLPMGKGPIAALFAHDVNDDQNSFAGAEVARDRILKSNGCST
ncbi:MAG TPA: hypothetical protein VH374_08830 [Polyangia bacterium]|jgi:hypothetical protein|nr:hypothetical protein [Polyangia bacterium]